MKKPIILTVVLIAWLCNSVNAAEIILQPGAEGKDSCAYYNYSYTGTHGDYPYMTIQRWSTGELCAYIEFDLSEVDITDLQNATLKMYVRDDSTALAESIYATRVTSAWNEATINVNTLPTYTTVGQVANSNTIAYYSWVSWDVTDMVAQWLDGTNENYGFRLYAVEMNSHTSFHSSDYMLSTILRPMLILTEGSGAPAIPEPMTMVLLGSSIGAFLMRKKK